MKRAAAPLVARPAILAAIDLGSNAARLAVARLHGDGHLERLEYFREPVRLGADVFSGDGLLTEAAMARALDAFRLFARVLDRHQVDRSGALRAVGTSATRDAGNRALFVDRVLRETGIRLEVISGVEEADLIRQAAFSRLDLRDRRVALVDVGGGSTEVSFTEGGQILFSESFNVGTVRMLEAFSGRDPRAATRLMEEYVGGLEPLLREKLGGQKLDLCVATGGNIEALATLEGKPEGGLLAAPAPAVLPIDRLKALRKRLEMLPVKERVRRFGLRRDRADVIVPAAHIYLKVARTLGVAALHVPFVGLVDGLLESLRRRRLAGAGEDPRPSQVRLSALVQGRRLHLDEPHAQKTAEIALAIYDAIPDLHGLGPGERILLDAAAILHDIGAFIEPSRHHKHSLYLIANLEIVGLSPRERLLVANVARYHRKSLPSTRHENFRLLTEEEQSRVRKLAAILRVADALDREHAGLVESVEVQRRAGRVVLRVRSRGDLLLESWSLDRRSDLFREVYGRDVELKVAPAPARRPARTPRPSARARVAARSVRKSAPPPRGRAPRPRRR